MKFNTTNSSANCETIIYHTCLPWDKKKKREKPQSRKTIWCFFFFEISLRRVFGWRQTGPAGMIFKYLSRQISEKCKGAEIKIGRGRYVPEAGHTRILFNLISIALVAFKSN